jgi:plastocyanin
MWRALANGIEAVSLAGLLVLAPGRLVYGGSSKNAPKASGTISGFVTYDGTIPSPKLLTVTKDPEVCGTKPVYDQSLVVAADHGLANTVITAFGQGHPAAMKSTVVRFDQKGCQYVPRVAVFPAGSTVLIINSDGILHNIHTQSTINPPLDIAQPGFKKQIRVTIAKPEIIKVTCDVHNWMEGWWYATGTPYYALTDVAGHYVLRDLPPGTYTVRFWHERLGSHSEQVLVRPSQSVTVDFAFKANADRGS